MRFMSVLVLFAYFLASLLPDAAGMVVSQASKLYWIPYEYRNLLGHLQGVPYQALIFGITYSVITALTAEQHRRPEGGDIVAFILLSALIFIIIQYGGVFLAPVLSVMHVSYFLFARAAQALFLALIAWKALHIPLGGLGVFLTTLLSVAMAVTLVLGLAFPVHFEVYWFTIIGTFIGFFAAFSHS